MSALIAEAKARLNSTPFGDRSLFEARRDHLAFLINLNEGKL